MLFGSAGCDRGADAVDNFVDVRLVHRDAVAETAVDVAGVHDEILARLEKVIGMPSSTILRVKSMVLARGRRALVVEVVRGAGVPAASRLFISTLWRRLDRVEVAVACGRCSSLARWRKLARGLVDGVADDE